MKQVLFFGIIFTFSFQVFAQQSYEGKTINRGKIYLPDSQVLDGQYLVFSSDSLEYYLKDSQQRHVVGLHDVSKVQEYAGHHGNTGMWIGAFVGAGIGVAVALGTKETERSGYIETTTIQTWPIYLFTGVGTLMGYLIGKNAEDWETVYDNSSAFLDNFKVKQNYNNGFSLSYTVNF